MTQKNSKKSGDGQMSEDFLEVLRLRNCIVEATHQIKDRLTALHEHKCIQQFEERPVHEMGISELVLYINDLEEIAILCT